MRREKEWKWEERGKEKGERQSVGWLASWTPTDHSRGKQKEAEIQPVIISSKSLSDLINLYQTIE